MTDMRRFSAGYITRRLAAEHAVLADPTASDQKRHGARCRLNRLISLSRALVDVPAMRRGLEVDRLAERRQIA